MKQIQTRYCFIKLSEETYETLLSELHHVEDLLRECEGCEEASEEELDEERNSNVLVEARPLGTVIMWQNGVQAESLGPLTLWVFVFLPLD